LHDAEAAADHEVEGVAGIVCREEAGATGDGDPLGAVADDAEDRVFFFVVECMTDGGGLLEGLFWRPAVLADVDLAYRRVLAAERGERERRGVRTEAQALAEYVEDGGAEFGVGGDEHPPLGNEAFEVFVEQRSFRLGALADDGEVVAVEAALVFGEVAVEVGAERAVGLFAHVEDAALDGADDALGTPVLWDAAGEEFLAAERPVAHRGASWRANSGAARS